MAKAIDESESENENEGEGEAEHGAAFPPDDLADDQVGMSLEAAEPEVPVLHVDSGGSSPPRRGSYGDSYRGSQGHYHPRRGAGFRAADPCTPPLLRLAHAIERAVLVRLYEATAGDAWSRRQGWLTSRPVVGWQGVVGDERGLLSRLNLERNANLDGDVSRVLGRGLLRYCQQLCLFNTNVSFFHVAPVPSRVWAEVERGTTTRLVPSRVG